jgi:hypothetical protein
MKHFAAKQDLDVSNLINASFRNRLGSPLKKVTECGQLPNAVADDLATCYLPTSLERRLGQPRIHRE